MRTDHVAHFSLLSHREQVAAVRRLAAEGYGDHEIAERCGLHLEQVRRALSRDDTETGVGEGQK